MTDIKLTGALVTLVMLLCYGTPVLASGDDEPGVSAPDLRKELLAMMAADQKARQARDVERTKTLDIRHANRMRELLDTRGWPKISEVGRDGAQAAWLLIQHADHDLALQKRALELMESAVEEGEAKARSWAYLVDRVAVHEDRKQTFGTQGYCPDEGVWKPKPIIDVEEVDERRADVGLGSMAEYVEQVSQFCPAPEEAAGEADETKQ